MHKKHLLQVAVLVFTVTLIGFSAWAVPGTINYQGKLTDPNGVSMDGFYIMKFYFYNAESDGNQLWNEQQDVAVTNGVYNVELGKTSAFPSDLFDNENLYLEVKIFSTSTGWETLSPRQYLTSSPFAMKTGYASTAGDADTLDGLHASDLFNTGDDYGRPGVAADLYEGTTALIDKYVNEAQADAIMNNMIVNDAVTSNKIADGAVGTSDLSENAVTSAKIQDGTIQQSDLSFSVPDGHSLDAADGAPVNAVYVNDSGNVGIGKTSPTESLDVNGNVKATSFIGDGSGLAGVVITESDPVFTSWDKSSGISITESQIGDLDHFTNSDETDPVFGTSVASSIISSDKSHWNESYSWGDHNTAGYLTSLPMTVLEEGENVSLLNNDAGYLTAYAETDPEVGNLTQYSIPKWDGSQLVDSSSIYEDSNGNIGIGTTSPSQRLHVSGNTAISGNLGIGTTTPGAKLEVYDTKTDAYSSSDLPTATVLIRNYNNSQSNNQYATLRFNVRSVTQGNNAHGALTLVQPNGWGVQSDFAFTLRNAVSIREVMRITSNGDVGIGTTSPSYKLHVNGTAYATGAAGALSDRRHKTNISNLSFDALEVVNQLRPVTFEWKEPQDSGMEGRQLGFIAQEVEKVLPEAVLTQDNEEQTKGLKYNTLIPLLTKAIQELKAQNEVLKAENKSLGYEIEQIKEAIGL